MDLGGTHLRLGIADAQQIDRHQTLRWPTGLTPEGEVQYLADQARQLLDEGSSCDQLAAIGVSLAASVNAAGQVVRWPNRPAWQGLPFQSLLESELQAPVAIEDDANAAALAECRFGAATGLDNLAVITVGTGIGAGLVLGGQLFPGTHGWAGEIGHMTLQPGGPACSCGRRGCLQALASGRSLDQAARTLGLTDGQALSRAAGAGNQAARKEIRTAADWLGIAAAGVSNLLDLQAVVIAGIPLQVPQYWRALHSSFKAHVIARDTDTAVLLPSQFRGTAGLHGALSIAVAATPCVAV